MSLLSSFLLREGVPLRPCDVSKLSGEREGGLKKGVDSVHWTLETGQLSETSVLYTSRAALKGTCHLVSRSATCARLLSVVYNLTREWSCIGGGVHAQCTWCRHGQLIDFFG